MKREMFFATIVMKQKIQNKDSLEYIVTKTPSSRGIDDHEKKIHVFVAMKVGGLEHNDFHFEPIFGSFPRLIKTIFVLMIGVRTLREGGSLLGFSLFKLCSIF